MNEEKIEKLLEMQQHPNDYSQREWDEMMADEEVRQTLETMTLLRRAYARDDAAQEDEEMTEREWQRLRRRLDAPARHASGRIAASVAGLLLTAGLAVAAFHPGGLLRWASRGNRWSAVLSGENLTRARVHTHSQMGYQDFHMHIFVPYPSATLSISYRIGNFKEKKTKQVDTSRMGY